MKQNAQKKYPSDDYKGKWPARRVIFKYLSLAIPFATPRAIDAALEISTGLVLAILGLKYLAATALIVIWQRFVIGTGLSVIYAMATLFANKGNNDAEVGEITRHGLSVALLIGVPISILTYFSGPILQMFGQDQEVVRVVSGFYRCGIISVIGVFILTVQQQFTLCIEKPRISLFFGIINNVLAIGIGSMLTFGLFGLPALNECGMGYGYSIAYSIVITGMLVYFLLHRKKFGCYILAKYDFLRKDIIGKLLKLGTPYTFQMLSDFFMGYFLVLIVGCIGKEQLAALRIVEMFYLFPLILIIRWPTVTCFLGGLAIKNNNKGLLHGFMYTNICVLALLITLWLVAGCIFSNELTKLFINTHYKNNIVITFTEFMFWLYPIGLYAESVRYAIAGVLRGKGNVKISMYNSLFWVFVVVVPLIYVAYRLGGDLYALFWIRNLVFFGAAGALFYVTRQKGLEIAK